MINPAVADLLHRSKHGLKAKIREQEELRAGLHADRDALELRVKSCGVMIDDMRRELEAIEHAIVVLSDEPQLTPHRFHEPHDGVEAREGQALCGKCGRTWRGGDHL